MEYAMFILKTPSPDHNQFTKHFALQCLEVVVCRAGADVGPEGQALRNNVVSLITDPGIAAPDEVRTHVCMC